MSLSVAALGCDDIEVTVTLRVDFNNPIIAARVFRMDSISDITFLGITNNFGTFRYRDVVGASTLVYRITAAGYLTKSTDAIHLEPSQPSVRQEIVLMPSTN